jgi:hypothetical protein
MTPLILIACVVIRVYEPIIMAVRSKLRTVFSRYSTVIMGQNLTVGMDYYVFTFCVDRVFAPGRSPV